MAECNWPIDKPPSAPAILKIKPGYLNPFDEDAVDTESIDFQSEDWESVVGRTIKKTFTPNVFKTVNTCKGIMMRIDNPNDPNSPCTAEDITVGATHATKDSNKYDLLTYKIRIPEIHFSLPIPNSLENPCDQDRMIMDGYPSIQAEDRFVSQRAIKPGDLCLVKVGNNGSLTKLFYAGPVDSEGLILPKDDGSSPLPQGKCLEDYNRIYFNSGAPGDSISGDSIKTVEKINNGVSPIISGEGIPDGEIIAGPVHKKWLVDLFSKKKKEGKYKGIIWTGVCINNGPADNLNMLTTLGIPAGTSGGAPGRSTIIYMPAGADPTSPLEIIYWFHDEMGFQYVGTEWDDLWDDLKRMIKERRNFVLVVPEMLWSREGANYQTGVPRRQTKAIVGSCNKWNCNAPGATILPSTTQALHPTYRNREWAAWGFAGIPATSNRNTPGTMFDTPFSFRSLELPNARPPLAPATNPNGPPLASQLPQDVCGDMVLLHKEVKGLLKKHFGVIDNSSSEHITFVANQKGGIAISNLARMGKLGKKQGQIHPTKIVFAHSDYSGMNGYGTVAKPLEGSNWYHDNDLYEIIKNIDKDTKLEVHVMWKGLPERPRQCASAFFGAINMISSENPAQTFGYCVDQLKRFYSEKLWMGTWTDPPGEGWISSPWLVEKAKEANSCGKPPLQKEAITATVLKEVYDTGRAIIESGKSEAKQMLPPFDNVVYKGWHSNTTKGVLSWAFGSKSEQPKVSVKKDIPTYATDTLIVEEGVTPKVEAAFQNFYGNGILYKSDLVGESKNVAILAPAGASPFIPYEMIYYFHGNVGKNGAAKTYRAALENQMRAMIEAQARNVIIVLMDIDPTPSSVSSMLWADGSFNNFHEEVLNRMQTHWAPATSEEICLPGPAADTPDCFIQEIPGANIKPKFFTIKAWSGGSRMLSHAIQNLDDKYIGKPGGLQRIDFLDANWGIDEGIVNTIYTNPKWSTIKPGTNFEIQMVASSVTFPPKNISAEQNASKYLVPPPEGMAAKGIWVIDAVATPAGKVPYKYFSTPSKLTLAIPPSPSSIKVDSVETPGGQIFGIFENKPRTITADSSPFFRGDLKNQIPSTEEIGYLKDYDAACRQTQTTAKSSTNVMLLDTQNCETNPLGLIDYKTFKFNNIKISPQRKEFTWGTSHLGEYLKAVDNSIWAKTTPPTVWTIKDLSPEWANGVDKVSGHASHREGIDIDVTLPKKGQSEHGLLPLLASDLDVDRALVFLILSHLNGAKRVFLDKKFFKPLEKRANFIALDGDSSSGISHIFGGDKALKPFLKRHLYGKPEYVKKIMRMLKHEVGHQDHFHVRILRPWGSHQTQDYPRWAINRLKSLGCSYKSPPSI